MRAHYRRREAERGRALLIANTGVTQLELAQVSLSQQEALCVIF